MAQVRMRKLESRALGSTREAETNAGAPCRRRRCAAHLRGPAPTSLDSKFGCQQARRVPLQCRHRGMCVIAAALYRCRRSL